MRYIDMKSTITENWTPNARNNFNSLMEVIDPEDPDSESLQVS